MKLKQTEYGKVKIIPLGGLEQIGMNMTAFEYEDSIIVVDCGLSFPSDDMLGIDLVIPDVTYLKDNIDKVKGFVITHGHEDHIGALPYVLKEVSAPIYATKLTLGLIDHKLEEHGLLKSVKRKVVKYGQSINLGCFRIEFIRTNHSIADAAALAIFSPAGTIVHTGDFKVDYTPVFGDAIDLQKFAELGKKGVLALMCDSTNAERPGFTQSEKTVGKTFDTLFEEHKSSRIFVANDKELPIAFVEICDEAETFVTELPSVKNICGAFCLPEYRGRLIYQNLINYTIEVFQKEGYQYLGVDYESFNSTAQHFWPKYFEPYTCSVTRRIDEGVLKK